MSYLIFQLKQMMVSHAVFLFMEKRMIQTRHFSMNAQRGIMEACGVQPQLNLIIHIQIGINAKPE